MERLLTSVILLALLVPLSACGDDEPDEGAIGEEGVSVQEVARFEDDEVATFAADLAPVNGSNVRGSAAFALAGEHLTVEIHARGLQSDNIHRQAIHGFRSERTARCPADNDGEVTARRAERKVYGPVVLSLEPFPTLRANRELDYVLTFDVEPGELEPLADRVIVLKGSTASVPGDPRVRYVPERPVACGELRSTDS